MSETKQPSAEEQAAAEAAAEAARKDAEAKAEAKAAAKEKPPAWQARDYNGPITGDQAAWRNANIKPVAEVRKK